MKPADIDEVFKTFSTEAGLLPAEDGTKPAPLSGDHLGYSGPAHNPTVLVSIDDVQNAAQLAAGQILPFALDGITIIYGDNGSGKTGYGRILKGACRARREKSEKILGNIYAKTSGSPARATLRFKQGDGEIEPAVWTDGSPGPHPESSARANFAGWPWRAFLQK